jgi:hypothetical protein
MSESMPFFLVGGPAHGKEVFRNDTPQLIKVDGSDYQRTPFLDDYIYRHVSVDVTSAIKIRLAQLGIAPADDLLR